MNIADTPRFKAVCFVTLFGAALLCLRPASPSASTMAIEPDGKIVLAGSANQWTPYCITPVSRRRCFRRSVSRPAAVRLDADGHPDLSFGSDGGIIDFRTLQLEGLRFTSVALPPGRGVRLGWAGPFPFRITALDGGGRPNLGFGRDGLAVGPPTKADYASTRSILSQPDGSLVVGGELETFAPKTLRSSASVAVAMRFSASGSPGQRLGEVSMGPGDLVQLADLISQGGAFIAVGSLTETETGPAGAYLARFSDSVFPYDPSFGGGAGLIRPGPFADSKYNVAFNSAAASDGRLIAVGRRGERILLTRYNVD